MPVQDRRVGSGSRYCCGGGDERVCGGACKYLVVGFVADWAFWDLWMVLEPSPSLLAPLPLALQRCSWFTGSFKEKSPLDCQSGPNPTA